MLDVRLFVILGFYKNKKRCFNVKFILSLCDINRELTVDFNFLTNATKKLL